MTLQEHDVATDEETTPDRGPGDQTPDDRSPDKVKGSAGKKSPSGRTRASLGGRQISVRALALSVLILGLIAGVVGATWVAVDRGHRINSMNAQAADNARAEQTATDYAVGAAQMDYSKIDEWKSRLTKGTTPELANRLTDAATSMEQITAPLQWVSTSTPITAKVRSVAGGKYVVDCFVNVVTKNTQAPEGVQSTATYAVTIDSNNDWKIIDVGGIGAMLGSK